MLSIRLLHGVLRHGVYRFQWGLCTIIYGSFMFYEIFPYAKLCSYLAYILKLALRFVRFRPLRARQNDRAILESKASKYRPSSDNKYVYNRRDRWVKVCAYRSYTLYVDIRHVHIVMPERVDTAWAGSMGPYWPDGVEETWTCHHLIPFQTIINIYMYIHIWPCALNTGMTESSSTPIKHRFWKE